jgi:4'-phosphopantetheinyl transferase
MHIYWLEQTERDVPVHNKWLCPGEAACLSNLRFAKRRADWRLGRWTAKRAICARLAWPPYPQILKRIEIRATPSGAPEAIIAGLGSPLAISLSHRASTAICTVSEAGVMLGCDLEVIEPRTQDFVVDYFTTEEQSWAARTPSSDRPEIVTLLWSAKESALKALQQGLRLDTRSVMVSQMAGAPDLDGWSPLRIGCVDGRAFQGWWRTAEGVVRTVAADSSASSPICLALPETQFHPAHTLDLDARSANETQPVHANRFIGPVCRSRTNNSISTLS